MKKMLLATALALLLQDVLNRRLLFQNKPAAVAPKETITHHFFVSGIGQKKTVDAAKICGGAENVVKTEIDKHSVNGLLSFILNIYTQHGSAMCIAHNNCMNAHRYRQLYLHCSLIYFLSSFQLFLHSDQPLSEGEIIPFSGVCQSGGGCIIHAGGGGGFTH